MSSRLGVAAVRPTCAHCGYRDATRRAPHPDRPMIVDVCATCHPDDTKILAARALTVLDRVRALADELDEMSTYGVADRLGASAVAVGRAMRILERSGMLVQTSRAHGRSGCHVYRRAR